MLKVFASKKCLAEVVDPEFGRTGYGLAADGSISQVVFDKGGQERRPKEEGGDFNTNPPGWVSLEEFKRRKEARARAWRKSSEGQTDFLARRRLRKITEDSGRMSLGMYGYGV